MGRHWLGFAAVIVAVIACGAVRVPDGAAACRAGGVSPNPPVVRRDPAMLRRDLHALRVINYYPATDGWTFMWTRWNRARLEADFARIAAANANGVRLIVHPRVFGFPDPDPVQIQKLADAVDAAQRHGLRVQLTLFDWWQDYLKIDESRRWASAVLAPYRDDPRVAFVELQNEMDAADPAALDWAWALVPCVKDVVGAVPVTISVSGSDSVPGLQRLVDAQLGLDFYDLHYYGKAALAASTFARANVVVGETPLRIGETGFATHAEADDGPLGTDSVWREAAQDQFFRTVEGAARHAGLPPVAPWILSDFAPEGVPPTRSAPSAALFAYGLLRTDGTPKPAMQSVAAMFGGVAVDESFNNGFENAAGVALPTNWRLWRSDLAQFGRDTTIKRSGAASACIGRSTSRPDGAPAFYIAPVKPVVPGQFYTATAWTRGQDVTGVTRIKLAWFDADGTFLYNSGSSVLPQGTTDWQQLSVKAQAPLDAAMVEIHLVSADNTGTVWFDDVMFD